MVGALIVSIVRIGMTFVGVDIFAQQIVFGAALILAVFVTIDRSKIPSSSNLRRVAVGHARQAMLRDPFGQR